MSEYFDPTSVKDSDTPFVIDPVTREITNKNNKKVTLIQGDHNSERFSFEIPRFIEGRDVAKCNSVQIHYINIGKNRQTSTGVYTVNDLNVYPFVHDILTCSWLISRNATKHEGVLNFLIRFAEIENETDIKYAWHTEAYEGIRISENINADATFEEEYVDIIEQWKYNLMNELYEYVNSTVETSVDEHTQDLVTRLDNLATVPEGGTTGDLELADIRGGANGKTYKNAGTAVREQFKAAKKEYAYGYVFTNGNVEYTFASASYIELKLNAITEVFCNGKTYSINNAYTKHEFSANSSLFAILFNEDTKAISVQHFGAALPDNCVIIGTAYRDVLRLNSYGINRDTSSQIDSYAPAVALVWCNYMPTYTWEPTEGADQYNRQLYKLTVKLPGLYMYTGNHKHYVSERTVDCIVPYDTSLFVLLYNPVKNDVIVESRADSKTKYGYYQIGVVNSLYGVFLNGATSFANVNNTALAPLILGRGKVYVEFDSVNKTVTFPDDTLVLVNKNNLSHPKYYQLADGNSNRVISYADQTSSALIIVLDTRTNKLAIITYSQFIPMTHVVIASFRTSDGRVSINAPYKWDGKVLNLSADDLDIPEYDISDFKTKFLVKSVNHRGYCKEAPENTLSAYKLSAKNGFDYAECDVSFTSDNIPVLLHDGTIDRTSNGTGNIGDLTLEQVRQYDFGSWFNSKYAGEKIPTFEEFVALCRKLSIHPYIEIKSSAAYTQEQIDQLIYIVKRYGMTGKVTYISFNTSYLEYVKNTDPNARLGYVVDSVGSGTIGAVQNLKTDTNEVFVDANVSSLTTDMVNLCINADIPLEVWTCNDANHINNTLDPYVSGVTSDNVHAGKTLFESNL